MQIISKFHDYYDVVQREGQDRSLAFVRQAQRFTGIRRNLGAVPQPLREFTRFAQEHSPGKVWYKEGSRTFSFTEIGFGLVLFAGKLYPCAEIKRERHDLAPVPKTFAYSHDSLLTFALEHGIEFDKKGRPKGMHRWRSDVWGSPKLRMFFELAGDVRFLDMTTVEPLPIVSWSSDSGTLENKPAIGRVRVLPSRIGLAGFPGAVHVSG